MYRKLTVILLFVTVFTGAVAQDAPIYESEAFSLYPRKVVEGKNHADIVADNALTSTIGQRKWIQRTAQNGYPAFASEIGVSTTIHNMAVEALANLSGRDSVWGSGTRDAGYATLLALAGADPTSAQHSLMKRVREGQIMQDAGTGGAWPVGTDRAVWTLGAWEVYLSTGDKQWLKRCYEIVRHSLMQDEEMVFDPETGLVRGEISLSNCRKEVYPLWMQPADISQSECLSTNALFFRAYEIASQMAKQCGDATASSQYQQRANHIKEAINALLWNESKGCYSQYLYGRTSLVASPRSDALGQALCIIFGIADPMRARRIITTEYASPFGVTCFSPQIPNIYSYHNNAVWPYIQAYWLWAAIVARNPQAVTQSIAAIYRPVALNASHLEYFSATSGETISNAAAKNPLLSVAASLSVAQRALTGIWLEEDGIAFRPVIPRGWSGRNQLNNYRYRKAILDISVQGFGDQVKACYLDGKKQNKAFLPASLTGRHSVRLIMNGEYAYNDLSKPQPLTYSLETPHAYFDGANRIAWQQVPGSKEYKILRNGSTIALQPEGYFDGNHFDITDEGGYAEYQVIAVSEDGTESFASEPLAHYNLANMQQYDMTRFAPATSFAACKGFSGNGAVELTTSDNTRIDITLDIPTEGDYLIDFRYANGSGSPVGGDMCATRMLWHNNKRIGCIIFPQRGKDIWNDWGYSTPIRLHLEKGPQTIVLIYELANENMNAQGVNRAMLDHVRLIRLQ